MYLIYDVTPASKPNNFDAPFSDTFAWPRLVHISWIVLNSELKPIEDYDCIIKPEGYVVSPPILKRAKLSEEEIDQKGEDLEKVLNAFSASVEKSTYLIGHNIDLNEKILAAEYMRKSMHPPYFTHERICLMQESTWFCKIPNKRGDGYKWPSLQELYTILFKQKYSPAGNARADVIAAARCFIMLFKGGQLEDLFEED